MNNAFVETSEFGQIYAIATLYMYMIYYVSEQQTPPYKFDYIDSTNHLIDIVVVVSVAVVQNLYCMLYMQIFFRGISSLCDDLHHVCIMYHTCMYTRLYKCVMHIDNMDHVIDVYSHVLTSLSAPPIGGWE